MQSSLVGQAKGGRDVHRSPLRLSRGIVPPGSCENRPICAEYGGSQRRASASWGLNIALSEVDSESGGPCMCPG